MKNLETLLKLNAGKSFDTPKKLNRSEKEIDPAIIDAIENGKVESEIFDELAINYPVFRYRTCITVHGNWPEVQRERIGGYKNIHQNQNGSLEIFYSAIDTNKIEHIREQLRGTDTPFRFQQSSTDRGFYIMREITAQTMEAVKAELKPIAEELTALNIYGSVHLYRSMDLYGRHYLVLSLDVLAIPATEVQAIILTLSRLTKEEHTAKREIYIREQIAEEAKRKAENEAHAIEREQRAADLKKKYDEVIMPQLQALSECRDLSKGILVAGSINRIASTLQFVFYRLDGKGSFGRLKYSVAFSETLNTTALEWKEKKQKPLAEILTAKVKYYLLQPTGVNKQENKPASKSLGPQKQEISITHAPLTQAPAQVKEQVQGQEKGKVLYTINF